MLAVLQNQLQRWRQRRGSRSNWSAYLGLSVSAGLLALMMHAIGDLRWRELGAAFFLAGASFFVGTLIGFLFGIPKTVSGPSGERSPGPMDRGPSYSPNTNLEDVSDWLTKMLVGVGLVQLSALPGFLAGLAGFWQRSVGDRFPSAYGAAVMVFFLCLGLLAGYLWTRLALVGDFIVNDPRQQINHLTDALGQTAMGNPGLGLRPIDQQVVTSQELRTAEMIAKISSSSLLSTADLKQQIGILTAKYDSIRATMLSGHDRTREMEIIASQLRGFALAAYDLTAYYANSASAGDRLAALAFLEIRPDLLWLDWLVQRFSIEVPFLQYHAAIALRNTLHQVPASQRPVGIAANYQQAYANALRSASDHHGSRESDEIRILEDCLNVLGVTPANPQAPSPG